MHKFTTKTSFAAAIALGLAALGTGCGSSGSDDPVPVATTGIPASAQQSTSGLLAYLNELIAGSSDSTEDVLVGDAVLPTDDTAEPVN